MMGMLLLLCLLLGLAGSTSAFLAQLPVESSRARARAGQYADVLLKPLESTTSSSEAFALSLDSIKQIFDYSKLSSSTARMLSSLLVTCPELFQQREEDLKDRIEYFRHELGCRDRTIKLCVNFFPRIFLLDHRDALPRRLNYLRKLGGRKKGLRLSLSGLFRVLRVMPEMVDLRISQSNRQKIRRVHEMFGFNRQQVAVFIATNPVILRDETRIALINEKRLYLRDRLDLNKTQLRLLALYRNSQLTTSSSTADLHEQLEWIQETLLEGNSSRLTDLVLRRPDILRSSTRRAFQECIPIFSQKLGVKKQELIQLLTRNIDYLVRTPAVLEEKIDWLLSTFDVQDVREAVLRNSGLLTGSSGKMVRRHKELVEAGISVDATSICPVAAFSETAWESWLQWAAMSMRAVSDAEDARTIIRQRFRFDPPRTERWILDLDKTHPELVAVPVLEFEARVDYLVSSLGCNEKDLGLFLRRCPRIFLLDSVNGLPRRIGYLKRSWFPKKSKSQMLRLFRVLPEALELKMPRRHAPNIRVLRDKLQCSRKDMVNMLVANPGALLLTNIMKSHSEMSCLLKDKYHLEDQDIAKMYKKNPGIVGLAVSTVQTKIDWFHDRLMFTSPEDSIRCFVAYPELLSLDPETNLGSKLDWLQVRLDSTPEEIAALVRKQPGILRYSITNNLGPKLDWVENEIGLDAMKAGVLSESATLGASLKGRLIPRSEEWKKTGGAIDWNTFSRMAKYTEAQWDTSVAWRLKD